MAETQKVQKEEIQKEEVQKEEIQKEEIQKEEIQEVKPSTCGNPFWGNNADGKVCVDPTCKSDTLYGMIAQYRNGKLTRSQIVNLCNRATRHAIPKLPLEVQDILIRPEEMRDKFFEKGPVTFTIEDKVITFERVWDEMTANKSGKFKDLEEFKKELLDCICSDTRYFYVNAKYYPGNVRDILEQDLKNGKIDVTSSIILVHFWDGNSKIFDGHTLEWSETFRYTEGIPEFREQELCTIFPEYRETAFEYAKEMIAINEHKKNEKE